MTHITILGVNSALSQGDNTSLILWPSDTQGVLLDCGSTVFQRVLARGFIDKINTVFISHRHQDHIGSLETLLEYRWLVLGQKTTVFGAVTANDLTRLLGEEWPLFADLAINPPYPLIPTTHSPRMPSTGILAEGVLYSGDTNTSLLETPAAQKADIIFHDAALSANPAHCTVADLAVASVAIRAKTYLIHYRATDYQALCRAAQKFGFKGVATVDMNGV